MDTKVNESDNLKWIKFEVISVLFVFWLIVGVGASVDIDDCATLDTAGETYILTTDISDSSGIPVGSSSVCIDIQADNIILDCRGNMINGDGTGIGTDTDQTFGVYLHGTRNVEVRDCTINNWSVGINIEGGDNNILIGNNITSNRFGVYICCEASNNHIDNNYICYNNPTDIYKPETSTAYGDDNTYNNPDRWNDADTRGCTYSCPAIPELSCYCSNCSECETKLNNSSCSFVYLTSNITNISETCIDNPENFNNKIFDCQRNTIDGVDHVFNLQRGIYLKGKSGNEIRNCIINDFFQGIVLGGSRDNTLTNNIVTSNTDVGILLSNSTDNTLTNNIVCLTQFRDIIRHVAK